MAEIVTLFRDSPYEWIKRNGPTLTHEVAQRFGLDTKVTLDMLKQMENIGQVKGELVGFSGGGQAQSGRGYQWTAT